MILTDYGSKISVNVEISPFVIVENFDILFCVIKESKGDVMSKTFIIDIRKLLQAWTGRPRGNWDYQVLVLVWHLVNRFQLVTCIGNIGLNFLQFPCATNL